MSKLTWTAEDVVRAVHGKGLHEQTWQAHGVAIDSRTVQPGDLFVALQGPSHDAHDYVAQAFAAGAVAAIVSRQPPQVLPQAPLVFVDDTFKALEELGRAGRARAQGKIIAVTGSVGKTGTKEMLRLMLSANGDTYANEGSFNNHWGVPLSLARLPADARFGVFEVGMNHPGELGPLSKMVQPHVALITTIEAVHLEFFANLDEIADAKAEIFQGLASGGAVVLNADNQKFERLVDAAKEQGIKKILSFGKAAKTNARMTSNTTVTGGSDIHAEVNGRAISYHLSAPGDHVALNSLGALLAATAAGGELGACAHALEHYKQPKGRGVIQSISLPDGSFTLIDESYNASPVAVHFAVRVLGEMKPDNGGRRLLVLGDMKELGAASPALHEGLLDDIIDAKITSVFCCGEMMAHLFTALPNELQGAHCKTSSELAPLVAAAIHPGDIVTVKGSKSMNMDVVINALKALDQSPTRKLAS